MDEQTFKKRTRELGLEVLKLVDSLPRRPSTELLARQLLRSATSVGANYRAACRGKSRADMASKLLIVQEETDEAIYWMELLIDGGLVRYEQLRALISEAGQILAMTTASIKTLRRNPKSKI